MIFPTKNLSMGYPHYILVMVDFRFQLSRIILLLVFISPIPHRVGY